MDPISLGASFLSFVLGLILLILFIVMAINVGKIRKNIEEMYVFERTRALRDGLINESGQILKQKTVPVEIRPEVEKSAPRLRPGLESLGELSDEDVAIIRDYGKDVFLRKRAQSGKS